ncbi:MAG TPA: tetratricopeptide repeat protein [Xanthobacteraceae bacterium]|nr:tetratricopeptide repeat protein [Xanthobacteraceae bacterium]
MAGKRRAASDLRSAETTRLFEGAVRAHQAGRLREAEQLYRRLLAVEPKHADAQHLIGVLAHQAGRNDAAIDLIGKALALNERVPEFHYNIGLAYGALGRFEEAAAHNRRAVALRPDYAEAHLNLGNALNAQGEHAAAIESYRRALALRPGLPEPHFNLANALDAVGESDEAIAHYRAALALRPDYADAHNNLGAALLKRKQLTEAAACFRRALALKPDLPGAALGLANALYALGDVANALAVAKRLHDAAETAKTRVQLFLCLCDPRAAPVAAAYRAEVIRAISEPWGPPRLLTGLVVSLLRQDPVIGALIARAGSAGAPALSPGELTAIATDDLLRAALQLTEISDAGLEQLLTQARRALLAAAQSDAPDAWLGFACALARQCFINEYVFALTPDEEAGRRALTASITSTDTTALRLAAFACHAPLHTLANAQALLDAEWPPPLRALLTQQIAEPAEEARIRASIPRLTAISDGVSQAVRAQYEENPYPRWTEIAPPAARGSLAQQLREHLPQSYRPFDRAGKALDVLMAGCGTGLQVATAMLAFTDLNVTAVDLSLASLAYAKRQTDALGFHDVAYGQADILALGPLGKSFDVIESTGVLHHMADPLAGWRVLLGLLRPDGVMHLALYSTRARRDIARARRWIAEQGWPPTVEGIRRARQAILALPQGAPGQSVTALSDFYSLSNCRDLLFHVQEHTFDIPALAAFLAQHRLEFLGFKVASDVTRRYAARFPDDPSQTDLANWDAFERDNPDTFITMYDFWIQPMTRE